MRDLLEVERELARVQSQIDSLTGQIRSLEQVTGKATVNVSYSIPPKAIELEYHDISNSLRYAWNGLLRSVSEVVAFILRVLPWIPIWFVGAWLALAILRFALNKTGAKGGAWQKVMFWKRRNDGDERPAA